jgi:hypothetical protein
MACQSCRTFSAYWGIFGKGAVPGSLPKFLKHPLARFALPSPDVLAASIVEDLQTALEQFMAISEDLGGGISVSGIE